MIETQMATRGCTASRGIPLIKKAPTVGILRGKSKVLPALYSTARSRGARLSRATDMEEGSGPKH